MAEKGTRIVKLNNSNYSTWKYKMELILIKENLWEKVMKAPVVGNEARERANEAVELAAPAAAAAVEQAEWKKLDNKARALIGLAVEDDQLSHIRRKITDWDSWEALRKYHEKSTLSNKVHIMRQICDLKMSENGNAEEHINQMSDLFQKLVDIGEEEISESWNVAMLLSSLPKSYDTLITALEARDENDLKFAFVQQKLLAEYQRRCTSDICNESESALWVKEQLDCYFCKEKGHMKNKCVRYKLWLAKQGEKENKEVAKRLVWDDNDGVAKKLVWDDEDGDYLTTDYSF